MVTYRGVKNSVRAIHKNRLYFFLVPSVLVSLMSKIFPAFWSYFLHFLHALKFSKNEIKTKDFRAQNGLFIAKHAVLTEKIASCESNDCPSILIRALLF